MGDLSHDKKDTAFDLEQAVGRWLRLLRSKPAIQDGDLAELEGYLRDKIEDLIGQGLSEEAAFRAAEAEFARGEALGDDYFRARSASRFNVRPPGQAPRLIPALLWNYLKVASRRIRREKAYFFTTLVGLTVGMASFFLIALYCRFERSYDGFHQNAGRLYRVQNDRIYSTRHDRSAACPPGLGPAMKEEFPEVAGFARLLSLSADPNTVSRTANSKGGPDSAGRPVAFFEKRIFFVDPSFLRIFSFPLVRGDGRTVLEEPDEVVLTESTAKKYFGDEDPLGRTLTVTTRFGGHDYRVAGVCRDIPPNSHLKFDLLLSSRRLAALWPSSASQPWSNNAFPTYLLLAPSVDRAALEAKFPLLVEKYSLSDAGLKREFHLQPLRAIHLTSRLRMEPDVNGDLRAVRFLEIVALFVLLIAWVNAVNLATARSLQRGKEVCVRKTLGAEKRQLARQFLFESVVQNILAFILALALVLTVLPAFGRLVGKPLSPGILGEGWVWVGFSFLAGAVLSGLYPAFILSSFRPALALRDPAQGVLRGAALRKALVLFQFATAVLLIASTLVVGKQLAFMQSRDLGVDLDQTLVLRIPEVPGVGKTASLARDVMSRLPAVRSATLSTSVPGRGYTNSASGIRRQSAAVEEGQQAFFIDVDENYFQFFSIRLVCGRGFSKGFASDNGAVVINEEMGDVLGFESPEKALLQNVVLGGFGGDLVQVVGVVKNHHHLSLREKIEPVIYLPLPGSYFRSEYLLSLKVKAGPIRPAISAVAAQWREVFPGQPLEYYFLDNEFNSQYDADERFGRVFGLSSLLAILISGLGLFGLASFSAERRTREIGIRKVFGATSSGIAAMMAREFVQWVILANLVAWPVAWIVMSKWLRRFAYRTTVGFETLAGAALLTLVIALATVSFKAVRSAAANPADSLRCE